MTFAAVLLLSLGLALTAWVLVRRRDAGYTMTVHRFTETEAITIQVKVPNHASSTDLGIALDKLVTGIDLGERRRTLRPPGIPS